MKAKYLLPALALGLCASPLIADELKLETESQKMSYIIGYQAGTQLKQQGFPIDMETLSKAIQEGLSGAQPRLDSQQAETIMKGFQEKQMATQKAANGKNEAAGKAFLAENKKQEGVTELENGLQYKILTAGTGKKPAATDTVSVNYRGTLIDGTEFDSSYKRGSPAEFPVNRVIPGWTQILQMMGEGAKWQVYIPSELAYGANGAGPNIGPNSTLVFDIELLKVK
ncbi:MAG: FKBP-type peptidyl-prolyl cis-trans isomerase [Candidatus Polarisedimenticolaceae bacterium]|nr:FKBP-type peptidyl-prolyl cis-trans isomerase [Candidatus Polarisedimenticolaceae bacterium]